MTPYEGPLDLDQLRTFLKEMRKSRESGTVEVAGPEFKRIFHFDVDTVRITSTGSRRTPNLGELLVLHGRMAPEQLKMCHESQKRLHLRFNEVVAVLGILPPEEVNSELMAQIQEEMCESFTLPGVRLKLVPGTTRADLTTSSPGMQSYSMDALELVAEINRRIDEWKKIEMSFTDFSAVPKITPEGKVFLRALKRGDPLLTLLSGVDGVRSLALLVANSLLPRFETYRALYLLFSQGYLDIAGAVRVDTSKLMAAAPTVKPTPGLTAPAVAPIPTPAATPSPRPAVLVIEDLAHIRRILAYELDRAGLQVYEASNGKEGLDLLTSLQVDAVILDMMMPVMDGLTVCREIRKDPARSGLPVLMLTARTRSDAIAQILGAGATDYLFKPYKREQLLEKVDALLKKG